MPKLCLAIVLFFCLISYQAHSVIPERNNPLWIQDLNGEWKFKLFNDKESLNKSQFYKNEFSDKDWQIIQVPGSWEMQGFETPYYNDDIPAEVTGVYRTAFTIPETWKDRNIVIYFEGISYAYEVWVNGEEVGFFESGFNRAQFDLTNVIDRDRENTLAIKVYRDTAHRLFDFHDSWSLSGIFRDVFLFAAPVAHIEDYTLSTSLAENEQSGILSGEIKVNQYYSDEYYIYNFEDVALPKYSVSISLSHKGEVLQTVDKAVEWRNKYFSPLALNFDFEIEEPSLWNAETPALYDIKISLKNDDGLLHKIEQKIGFRQVTIEKGIFKINGRPIKMRGVNLHELYWKTGMAVPKQQWEKDIQSMKAANINAIRSSHYPLDPKLLELADYYGMYVIDEVPLNLNKGLDNDGLLPQILARTWQTYERDKNSTSVIAWSIGNEHIAARAVDKGARLLKMLDPTRPIFYPNANYCYNDSCVLSGMPSALQVLSLHYLNANDLKRVAGDDNIKDPIVVSEFNHASGNAFGGLKEKWEVMQKSEKFAGGFIWHWMDQGILKKVDPADVGDPFRSGELFTDPTIAMGDYWIDEKTIIDSRGEFSTDGIVYANRQPSEDYYQTKQVYSPVQILENQLTISDFSQEAELSCANYYDFISTDNLKFIWRQESDGKVLMQRTSTYKVDSQKTVKIKVPLLVEPKDGSFANVLYLDIIDHNKRNIFKRSIIINTPNDAENILAFAERPLSAFWTKKSTNAEAEPISFDQAIIISNSEYRLDINEQGKLQFHHNDNLVFEGPYLTIDRKPNVSERKMYKNKLGSKFWEASEVGHLTLLNHEYSELNGEKHLILEYELTRINEANTSSEKIKLNAFIKMFEDAIDFHYEIEPLGATDYFLQLGVAFEFSEAYKRINWLGDGPYHSYPDKSDLNVRGFHTVQKHDRYFFNGNRAKVDALVIKGEKDIPSVVWLTKPSNIDFNLNNNRIRLTHSAKVAGLGTRFQKPSIVFPADQIDEANGAFRILLPLSKSDKSDAINTLLGDLDN